MDNPNLFMLFILMSKTMSQTALKLWSALPSHLICLLTDFLSIEELENVAKSCKCSKCLISKISSLGSIKSFTSKYLNKSQRSIYMEIYSKPQIKELERKHIQKLHQSSKEKFIGCYNGFQIIFKKMKVELEGYDNANQLVNTLKTIIFDPEFPIPKIRRKSVGAFCNSPLQFYLVDTQFGIAQQFLYQHFSQFLLYLSTVSNNHHESRKKYFTENPQISQRLSQLLLMPEIITPNNYLSYYIPNDCQTNFIVMLYAITSNIVDSIYLYVKEFHDPIELFLQIVLRYSIFRNFVLGIEEKFRQVFLRYGCKLKEMLNNNMEYDYCFWRPAMSMWYSVMKVFHQKTNKVSVYLLAKKRIQNLKRAINEKKDNYQCDGRLLINQLNYGQYLINLRQQIYSQQTQFNGKQTKLQESTQFLDQVITQYLEYTVDLSVNQLTVHWCGHSQQVLDQPYEQFEDTFLDYNQQYAEYIRNLVFISQKTSKKVQVFRDLLEEDISLLEEGYLKPVTICKIIQYYNQAVQQISKSEDQQNQQKTSKSQLIDLKNNKNLKVELKKISSSTQSNDKLIDYFNTKNMPQKYQNQQLSISEQLSNSLKIRSISTIKQQKKLLKTTEMKNECLLMKQNIKYPQICQYTGSQVEQVLFEDQI